MQKLYETILRIQMTWVMGKKKKNKAVTRLLAGSLAVQARPYTRVSAPTSYIRYCRYHIRGRGGERARQVPACGE